MVDGRAEITVDGANTVAELIAKVDEVNPGFKDRKCDEHGELNSLIDIYVRGEDIRFRDFLDTPLADGDEVVVGEPALCGADKIVWERKVKALRTLSALIADEEAVAAGDLWEARAKVDERIATIEISLPHEVIQRLAYQRDEAIGHAFRTLEDCCWETTLEDVVRAIRTGFTTLAEAQEKSHEAGLKVYMGK